MARGVYQIEVPGVGVYEVEADSDEQAAALGDFIQSQAAAGNPDLKDVELPFNAVTEQAPPVEPSAVGAALRGAGRGGTLNFMDEIGAVGNAAGLAGIDNLSGGFGNQQAFWDNPEGFWAAVKNNMAESARIEAADKEQHGLAEGLGQVAGTFAVGGPALRAASAAAPALAARVAAAGAARPVATAAGVGAAGAARPVATAAGVGAAAGGGTGIVSGFGAGDTLDSRVKSAKIGGLTGTVLGAGAGTVVAGLGPAVRNYWNTLRGNVPDEEALRQLVTKLRQDGFDVTSPSGVQALRTELARFTDKPVSLADVGAATRARVGVGLRTPSAVQDQSIDAVTERAQGQAGRLIDDVRATVAPRTDVHAINEALVEQRATEALPLREQALFESGPGFGPAATPQQALAAPTGLADDTADAGLRRTLGLETPDAPVFANVPALVSEPQAAARQSRVPNDPVLQQLARLPAAKRALKGAKGLAELERGRKAVLGEPIDDLPDLLPGQDLDMRALDYLKRFLDDEVNSLKRRGEGSTFKAAEFNEVKELRNAIRERMRVAVPEYGEYLDKYRGSSDLMDALEGGREFRNLDPEQIAAEQAGRTTGEQELYRVGAARNFIDRIKGVADTGNPAMRVLNNPQEREQLTALGVGDANAARLNTNFQQERELSRLTRELQGSDTAQRSAAAADADAGLRAAVPFNPGNPIGWLGTGLRAMRDRVMPARNAAVNEALLPRVLETNPTAIDSIIGELEARGERLAASRLRRLKTTQNTAAFSGAMIGSPVALPEGY